MHTYCIAVYWFKIRKQWQWQTQTFGCSFSHLSSNTFQAFLSQLSLTIFAFFFPLTLPSRTLLALKYSYISLCMLHIRHFQYLNLGSVMSILKAISFSLVLHDLTWRYSWIFLSEIPNIFSTQHWHMSIILWSCITTESTEMLAWKNKFN